MAKVPLGPSQINQIVRNVERVYEKDYEDVPPWPDPTAAVGDALQKLLIPPGAEAELKKILPNWVPNVRANNYLSIILPEEFQALGTHSTYVSASTPSIVLPGSNKALNVPGISSVASEGHYIAISIDKVESIANIEDPDLRQYIEGVVNTAKAYCAAIKNTDEARSNMEEFLNQYSTLQQAVKAFGPALLQFVPSAMKETYNKPTEKRVRKPNPEKITVNVDSLIAKAATEALNLN